MNIKFIYEKINNRNAFNVFLDNHETLKPIEVGEICMVEDGFYQFFPVSSQGYWPSWAMRELADKIDELNAPWEQDIEDYFNGAIDKP